MARLLFLAVLVVPLNALRMSVNKVDLGGALNAYFYPGTPWGALRLGLVAACGVCAMVLLARPIARAVSVLLLVLAPFVVLTFARGAILIVKYDPSPFRDRPLASRLAGRSGHARVVWIIFDEMDQRLAFVDRAPNLSLKEFDRFRAEALYADNAYPPAGDTAESIPSLTIGRVVRRSVPCGPGDLELHLKTGGEPVRWSAQPTVFSGARALGFNAAILGWYHPYCRQFSDSLTDCGWNEHGVAAGDTGSGFPASVINQLRSIAETETWSPWGPTVTTEMRVRDYRAILERARHAVSDPSLGLVFLHLPVPHPPFVYDRYTRGFTLHHSPIAGYWDALALADRTLGELRGSMERAGVWDRTTVLVSADHHFRNSEHLDGKTDQRVPFLLRLGGQEAGTVFHQAFNTVLTHDLILALLGGKIQYLPELTGWMAARADRQ